MILKFNLPRYLTSKSILLSLLIHLIIFSAFIFVFPLKQERIRPELIFLGSILKQRDLIDQNRNLQSSNLPPAPQTFVTKHKKSNLYSPTDIHLTKPKSENMLTRPKATIKLTFPTTKNFQSQESLEIDDVGIDSHIPPYKPLKLEYK